MEVFALKYVEKTPLKEWEKLAQSSPKILLLNNDQTPKFIGCQKLAVGVCQACRSTGPVDRQRSKIRPLEPPVDRLVDPKEQRALLSVSVDPVGRPAICQVKRARPCTSVDSTGRPTLELVDYKGSKSTS